MRISAAPLVAALSLLCSATLSAGDLNTDLTLCTFKLTNPGSTATGFILTRPLPSDRTKTQFLLITAEHVLSAMKGDEATIIYRKPDGDGFVKREARIKVRQGGKNLWTRHPSADVAVLPVSPPSDVPLPSIPIGVLASDEDLKRYEVHPGDSIRALGYPHANQFEANGAGFPVCRLGCISSYPLLPTRKTRTFLYDTNVFEGVSGGPVYLSETNRFYGGRAQSGRVQLILGLTSGQHWLNESYNMVYGAGTIRQRLELAIAVHASAIREVIDLLPQPTTAPTTRTSAATTHRTTRPAR